MTPGQATTDTAVIGSVADNTGAPVLLYDGRCGLCNRTVRTVLRFDRKGTLLFASLRGEYAREALRSYPEVAQMDTVVWLEPAHGGRPERVLVRSAAALRLAGYLGGVWRVLLIGYAIPRPLRDLAYAFLARIRYPLFGSSCMLVPTESRERFLDLRADGFIESTAKSPRGTARPTTKTRRHQDTERTKVDGTRE